MSDAIIISRRFIFGDPQNPDSVVTFPVGVFVDEKTANDAMADAAQIHALSKGVIVFQGKPTMTVEQFLCAIGISAFGLVQSKARVREASLLIASPGDVKLHS